MAQPRLRPSAGSWPDLIFGVLLPGLVLGPLMAFGLMGALLTWTWQGDKLIPRSRELLGVLVLLIVVGSLGLVLLATVIKLGPEQVGRKPWLRWTSAVAVGSAVAASAWALAMQLPSLAWSIQDPRNYTGLLFQLPAVLVLGGPIVVGLKYLVLLIRAR